MLESELSFVCQRIHSQNEETCVSSVGQIIDHIKVAYIRVGSVFCRSDNWQNEETYISVGIVFCQSGDWQNEWAYISKSELSAVGQVIDQIKVTYVRVGLSSVGQRSNNIKLI